MILTSRWCCPEVIVSIGQNVTKTELPFLFGMFAVKFVNVSHTKNQQQKKNRFIKKL